MSKANNISFGIILFLAIIFLENVTACNFYCSTCGDCNSKINSADSWQTICLNASILVNQQICIYDPENFSNKTFDCQGYEIRSSSLAIVSGYYPSGIYLHKKSNNTIKNCIITNFMNGIYLKSSSNNTIINNTITKNTSLSFGVFDGIYLTSSSNNTLINNHITSAEYGIYTHDNSNFNMIKNNILTNNKAGIAVSNCFPGGDDIYLCLFSGNLNNTIKNNEILNNDVGIYSQNSTSIINGNIVCGNTNLDFNSPDWLLSFGDNNTCSNPDGWNDNNKQGCTYTCGTTTINCTCASCDECKTRMNDPNCTLVTLTTNITNHLGICINNPPNFTNKIFDCQGNIIEGKKTKDSYGILLSKKSNNTIRNCMIEAFDYGIYIYASSENKIINNTLNSNNYGIYVSSPNSLSCSGYGYVCIHSSYGDYVYSQVEKRFVLISGDEQSSNNEISNNSACENEILDISLNNENKNFGNNKCDKISNNSNSNLVFCSKNCSSSEEQNILFLYYCDYDADSYFSKSISGFCFGNGSCIPENCSLNKGNDCDDENASIHPNVNETLCNGIDEDCDGFDKCGKRIWSSDKYNREKNTFYSYQDVYASGTGFNPNSEIEIYITPHKNPINLSDFKIKKNITTDENGNFIALLWNLPAWNELSILYYNIVADENLNGIYENNEAIDAYPFGFSVDPLWASDENGNPKEIFCDNEKIYVNGSGLSVSNTTISLIVVPDMNLPIGTNLCNLAIAPIKTTDIDDKGNFKLIVDLGSLPRGEYDIIPDMDNDCILDENEKKAMDDNSSIGFSVVKPYDFNSDNLIDIFDAVYTLEYLSGKSEETEIYNLCCDRKFKFYPHIK
ncbi:hypothetical protein CVT91_06680 [Candidatus Atribacteria bacterium HGW-Atribacteria-1]|nr:MAG: hypothetical protein CVT91_06680 [Candidatus Atribacteria bacterium HGW-Atribacteria-1]